MFWTLETELYLPRRTWVNICVYAWHSLYSKWKVLSFFLLWTQGGLNCSKIEGNHCSLSLFIRHSVRLNGCTIKIYLKVQLGNSGLYFILLCCSFCQLKHSRLKFIIYHTVIWMPPIQNSVEKTHYKTSSFNAGWELEWQFMWSKIDNSKMQFVHCFS